MSLFVFFFQAEDGIRDYKVTGVQTCALPIWWRGSNSCARSATSRFARTGAPLSSPSPGSRTTRWLRSTRDRLSLPPAPSWHSEEPEQLRGIQPEPDDQAGGRHQRERGRARYPDRARVRSGGGDQRLLQDDQIIIQRHRAERDRQNREPAGRPRDASQAQRRRKDRELAEESGEGRNAGERQDEHGKAAGEQRRSAVEPGEIGDV